MSTGEPVNEEQSSKETVQQESTENDKQALDKKVHSANEWEKADLGDGERRDKFLRLMGGAKKEHHGRFVIGDREKHHGKTDDEVKKTEEALETQFKDSLEHKLSGAARKHTGIGYHEEADEVSATPDSTVHKNTDSNPASEDNSSKDDTPVDTADKDKTKPTAEEKSETNGTTKTDDGEPPKKKPMMAFVKASSDS